jgi:DNA polymerase III delta prime subunit
LDEPLLRPPDQWTEELLTLPVDGLWLSSPPGLKDQLPGGRTLDNVADDLARGAWLARRRGQDNVFSIGGHEFELRVKARLAEHGQHPIAQVLNVDEARSVPRRVGWLAPRKVRFYHLWDEAWCDLDALEQNLARRLTLTGDERGRPAGQQELDQHQELHRAARREYGDLNTLITLLEQRPVEPERTIVGAVVGSGRRRRQQVVTVHTEAAELGEFRGKRVRLRLPDGRAFNTRVLRVHQRMLDIAEPQDWPDAKNAPDALVEVSVISPFGLRRNRQALEDFLAGRVEGAWHDLARLVCRPAELALPPLTPPQTFYCDSDPEAHTLNEEQRCAVTGAVTSPHAFLIQGPPGTGKTEVIIETIQQLVGQGERVLLLAPAHVAVDEVLQRVGGKPGMRPLRITFDDDKVDENVRAHLPQNVGIELVNRVLRPTGPSRAEHWAAELGVVDRQLAALTAAQSTGERLNAVRQRTETAGQRALEASARLANYRSRSSRELDWAEAELSAAQRRYAEAKAADINLAEATAALHTRWGPLLAETTTAAKQLSAATRVETDWAERTGSATREYQLRRQEHTDMLAQHDTGIDQLRKQIATEHQLVTDATAAEQTAANELARVEADQGRLGQLVSRVGLGRTAEARRTLAREQAAAEQRRTTLQAAETQLAEAIRQHNEVDSRGRGWLAQLRDTAERNRRRAEDARGQRALALNRLLDALARFGDLADRAGAPVPMELTSDAATETCGRLAMAVLGSIAEVTPPIGAEKPDWWVAPTDFGGVLTGYTGVMAELWSAESARPKAQRALLDAEVRWSSRLTEQRSLADTVAEHLAQLERADRDTTALLDQHRAESAKLGAALLAATGELRALGVTDDPGVPERLRQRQHMLRHLPTLERRWRELVADQSDDQLIDDIQTSALRATNLVCATTKGIVGRGSDVVRDTDYDTLIVDEASRVTDSEFLIGAVRARRWVLVGDEHQLPPHVDQNDEHFLHALFALYRHHRTAATSVEEAVDQLAEYWQEDAELREFRGKAVRGQVAELVGNGLWESAFRARMADAYAWFAKREKSRRGRRDEVEPADPDRELLRTMNQYLVRSLFERVVSDCADELKQSLKWQRRMAEPLARIVNKPVYGGAYLSPPDEELARAGARRLVVPNTFDRPVVFIDTSRYKDAEDRPAKIGHGFENELERRMVLRACTIYHDELDRTRSEPIKVSVLSFYLAQARALDDALDRTSFPLFDIKLVDVVDRIQGQQSDLVFISFVRAKDRGAIGPRFGSWLQDVRRLNVACTRARRALVLVGHADTLRHLGTNRDGTPRDANALPAVNFYRELFGLFDGLSPEFRMLHKFDPGPAG